MLGGTEKPSIMRCPQDGPTWSWMTLSSAGIKEHGFTVLLIALCLYNLSKLTPPLKVWAISRGLLPDWLNEGSIDKRIDVMTTELRMEMRDLSQQMIEFQRWSQILNVNVPDGHKTRFCRQCRGKMLPSAELPIFRCRTSIHPTAIDNEIDEGNWLRYLHKYVYNPNPRILDTGELENAKRAYSM